MVPRVLDIGCGLGGTLFHLAKTTNAYVRPPALPPSPLFRRAFHAPVPSHALLTGATATGLAAAALDGTGQVRARLRHLRILRE